MRLFVINLERSAARRALMADRLGALGIKHEFFPAVDGAAGGHQSFGRARPGLASRYGGTLAAAEVACFASHFLLWARCEALSEPIVVLEDDVELDDRFPEALQKAANAIRAGAIFVRLCGLLPRRHVAVSDLGDGYRIVRYLKGPSGAQAYIVTPTAARRLTAAATEWAEPVDDFIDRFWHHRVPAVAVMPYRVCRAAVPSDIGDRPALSTGGNVRRRVRRLIDAAYRVTYNRVFAAR